MATPKNIYGAPTMCQMQQIIDEPIIKVLNVNGFTINKQTKKNIVNYNKCYRIKE